MGPRLVQKKTAMLEATPVPQQKKEEVQKLLIQIGKLEQRETHYMNQLRDTAKAMVVRDWIPYSQRKEMYDEELIAELYMRSFPGRPDYAKKFESAIGLMSERAGALLKKIHALGIENFINEQSFQNVYLGILPRWRAALFMGKERFRLFQQKQRQEWKEFEDSFHEKPYPTISAQRGEGIPFWQRPAPKVPKSGTDWLRYPGGPYLYVGEGGKPVPKEVLNVQRELERIRLQKLGSPMGTGEVFRALMPIISSLDAAVTEVQVMWDKGISWKGTGKVVLYLALAATEVVFVGQIAAKSAARTTGRQLASSLSKAEGRLTVTQAQRDVFETALRELKPGEVRDLLRLARPGKGPGWHRMMEELAKKAGRSEITGDVMRAYMKETMGASRLGRAAFRTRHGIADFYSNLGFFSRENFRERVQAEFFNELRLALDVKAGRAVAESLRSAGLGRIQSRIASDALFYTSTSFSRGTQKAFARLVQEQGWPKIIRELRKDILLAKKAGAKDTFGAGVRSGLERLLPKYSRSFHYAPMHRLAEYGIFLAIAPHAFDALLGMATGIAQKANKTPENPVQTIEDARKAWQKGMEQYLGEKY